MSFGLTQTDRYYRLDLVVQRLRINLGTLIYKQSSASRLTGVRSKLTPDSESLSVLAGRAAVVPSADLDTTSFC